MVSVLEVGKKGNTQIKEFEEFASTIERFLNLYKVYIDYYSDNAKMLKIKRINGILKKIVKILRGENGNND